MKFKMTLNMEIEFEMPDGSTRDDAVAHFFAESSYIENGELIKADYDVEEVMFDEIPNRERRHGFWSVGPMLSSYTEHEAFFVSRWNDGSEHISPCKLDYESKRVFDIISISNCSDSTLIEEVVIWKGREYPVYARNERLSEEDFWYE